MRVRPYSPGDAHAWDDLVARSTCASFQHSRRFLAYHGDRFVDASMLAFDGDKLVAVCPGAALPSKHSTVMSHPGATYGGVVFDPSLGRGRVDDVMLGLCDAWTSMGFRNLAMKPMPACLAARPDQRVEHWLWRQGATTGRVDLWNVVELADREIKKGHKHSLSVARREGLETDTQRESSALREAHLLIQQCLHERHDIAPVHDPRELVDLSDRLAQQASMWSCRDEAKTLLACAWVFDHGPAAWHTQYIASSASGRKRGAVVLLVDAIARAAEQHGVRRLSFGASTEDAGRSVNAGLFAFKAGFGSGAIIHPTYELALEESSSP